MQREWKPEYVENGQLRTPKFFRDWKWGLSHVLAGARKRPIIFFLLVMVNWIDAVEVIAGPPLMLIRLASVVMFQYLLYEILITSWNALIVPNVDELSSSDKTATNEAREGAARLFGTNFLYGLGVLALSILLIAPGIWFAVTRCLSSAVVCVEKQRPGLAFGVSDELVKGHFWRAFRYIILWPFALLSAAMLPLFILGILVMMIFGEAIFDQFWTVTAIIGATFLFILHLSVMPLIISLYAYLREKKKETLPIPDPV